jgi:HEAT repeat protein
MMADEEAEVRRVVASRIGGGALYRMASDEDTEVRLAAVRRLEPRDLSGFHRDPDWRVRYEAACRASPGLLREMINDPDELVREFVLQRLEQVEAQKATNVVRLDPRPSRQTLREPLR